MSYKIYKISDCSPVDLAAEELKKYLRMMMPEAGDIKIERADGVRPDGFCLGTMQDLSLDTSEAENAELDAAALEKAIAVGINIYRTELPVFDLCAKIAN